jgi:hypothetical protein
MSDPSSSRREQTDYQLGYAEGLLRQLVEHADNGTDMTHTIDLARKFLADETG